MKLSFVLKNLLHLLHHDSAFYVCNVMYVSICVSVKCCDVENSVFLLYDLFSIAPKDFNSYGSRRGNDAVMARGTFANIRLVNKLVGKPGPKTLHVPSGETVSYEQFDLCAKCVLHVPRSYSVLQSRGSISSVFSVIS